MIAHMNAEHITTVLDSMNIPYSLNTGRDRKENPIKGPANNKNFDFYKDDFSDSWILVVKKQPAEIVQSTFKTSQELQILLVENFH